MTFTLMLVVAVVSLPGTVFAARFDISGTEALGVGGGALVSVMLDTEGESVNAIEGIITIQGDVLRIDAVYDGISLVPFWVERPRVVGNEVRFSGIIPSGISAAAAPLFELVISGAEPGVGQVVVSEGVVFINDGLGTSFSARSDPTPITVSSDVEPIQVALLDETLPEEFDVRIVQDTDVFDGQAVVVFEAQDKGSGIAYYEVQETNQSTPNESLWARTTSPHLLVDQQLASYIFVKAVDRAGNSRVVALEPRNTVFGLTALFGGVGILLVLLVGLYILRRYVHRGRC